MLLRQPAEEYVDLYTHSVFTARCSIFFRSMYACVYIYAVLVILQITVLK